MKKIKTVVVTFDIPIEKEEINLFRAAISNLMGRDKVLFHHHLDTDKYLYKYPLIQYKQINGKFAIFSLQEGSDELLKLLELKNNEIEINGKKLHLNVVSLHLKQHTLQIWDKFFNYRITNWIALNEKNYKEYHTITALKDRVLLLEKTLIAHILSFAEGVEWNVDKKIELFISDIHKVKWIKYKNTGFMAFDLSFSTNLSLPNYIGLGKSVSIGNGVVKKIKKNELLTYEQEIIQKEVYE